MHRHDSVSCLFRYFLPFRFLLIFQFLQFPSRRAKFRRDCESASGIPPAFLFVSLSLSPSLLLSLLPFLGPRFSFSRLSRRRRKQSGFPRVIKRLRSAQKGLTIRFFARHLLSDSVLPFSTSSFFSFWRRILYRNRRKAFRGFMSDICNFKRQYSETCNYSLIHSTVCFY